MTFTKFLTLARYAAVSSLLLLFTAFSISAQVKDDDMERKRIAESKIKVSTQWAYRYTQGKLNSEGSKTAETKYDNQGNPIEIVNYRSSGEISSKVLYKYDKNNQRTEYVMYQKKMGDSKLSITYKQTIQYNKDGVKISELIYDGAMGYRITYDYSSEGKLKQILKFDGNNKVSERWVYSYDGNNQQVNVFVPDQTLDAVINKKFSQKGELIEEQQLNASGKEVKKVINKYNSQGLEVKKEEYAMEKLIKSFEYVYDSNNLLVEVVQNNPDGTSFTQSRYSYDTAGNILEERWSEGNQDEFSHKQSSYDRKNILLETDQYFAPYKYRVLYKYTYEYF